MGTLDGEHPENPGEQGGPAGGEGFFGDPDELRLGIQAQKPSGGRSIQAGGPAQVLGAIGDVNGEMGQEFQRREMERLSFPGAHLHYAVADFDSDGKEDIPANKFWLFKTLILSKPFPSQRHKGFPVRSGSFGCAVHPASKRRRLT